ncbi:putative HTH-type transcriptional regulator for conjugative element pMERPH [uncultured Thiomicrorhabdus sp.]
MQTLVTIKKGNIYYMKTITDRINKILLDSGLNQSEAARYIGTTPQALRKWQSGESTEIKGKNLLKLSKLGKTSMEWIQTGQEKAKIKEPTLDYNADIISTIKQVPLIDMVAAGNWTDIADPYPIGEAEEWFDCPVKHGINTFAVRINGESMLPKFEHGEILFCDPSQRPENKDYVIAKLTDENQATFKQLVIDGNTKMLKAINPHWPMQYIPINGNCEIVGKVIARLEKF